jgi:hypothetical protein
MSHSVWIGWGAQPDDGQEAIEYEFKTKAELAAFLFGVDEADGWLDYRSFDEPGYTYNEDVGEWQLLEAVDPTMDPNLGTTDDGEG